MRRPLLLGLIAALLTLPVGHSWADEQDAAGAALAEFRKQVQRIVDHILELQTHLTALEKRVAALEKGSSPVKPTPRKPLDRKGKIGLPISTRTIPAYATVTREHLIHPRTRTIERVWLPAKAVPNNALLDLNLILGRVTRHEKPAGYIFLASEFYPVGTRPGPMAGVPAGKRGVWVESSEIPGLEELRQHDRFDLLMTTEVAEADSTADGRETAEPNKAEPESEPHPNPRKARKGERVEVRTIVSNGDVVLPADGDRTRVFIAVDPEEAAALNLARSLDARIEVAVRSGQPSRGSSQGEVPDLGWIRVYKPSSIPAIPKEGEGDR